MKYIVKIRVPIEPGLKRFMVQEGTKVVGFSGDRNDPGLLLQTSQGNNITAMDVLVVELGEQFNEAFQFAGFFVVGHKSFVVLVDFP